MENEIEIVKGKPMPRPGIGKSTGRPAGDCKYPIDGLEVGDAFDAGPYSTKLHQTVLHVCTQNSRVAKFGWKFASRKYAIGEGKKKKYRLFIWRVK
jgi:hypothetical protein